MSQAATASSTLKRAMSRVNPTAVDFDPAKLARAVVLVQKALNEVHQARLRLDRQQKTANPVVRRDLAAALDGYRSAAGLLLRAIAEVQAGSRDRAALDYRSATAALQDADAHLQRASNALR